MSDTDSESEKEGERHFSDVQEIRKRLTKDDVSAGLYCVGPTFRKIDEVLCYNSFTYAYVAINLRGRNLTDVDILPHFCHIMFVDVSSNRLTDGCLNILSEMEQILAVYAENNLFETLNIPTIPKLQILSLRNNRITKCEMDSQPNLQFLELGGNNIREIEPNMFGPKLLPKLKELSLKENGLTSTSGIYAPNLVSLFLGDNDIKVLEGLDVLTNLKFLHLRNNPLESLDGFSAANKKLFYINIRGCKIKSPKELKKLLVLPRLERIVVSENPFAKDNYRVLVTALLPKIRRIDKKLIGKKERMNAEQLRIKMKNDNGDFQFQEDEEND